MKSSIKKGLGFGLTSGIITTLGIITGLYSVTNSSLIILEGIVIIAIADSLSDALGMHISEEFDSKNSKKEIWDATVSTLFFKFVFAISFIFPFLIWEIYPAVMISLIWGLSLILVFSFFIAKSNKSSPWRAVGEHLIIGILVIVATHQIGGIVKNIFKMFI